MPIFKSIVQRVPNNKGIHAPSKLAPIIKMSNKEFISNHADNGKGMAVSLHDDGISNPQTITTYVIPIPLSGGTIPSEAIIVSED